MLDRLWDTLVRWRTWLVNTVLAIFVLMPELLNSPEVLAVVPAEYQRWFLLAAFVLNIWMRPRPATRASDPEVQVKKVVNKAEGPATVIVKADGEVKAILDA